MIARIIIGALGLAVLFGIMAIIGAILTWFLERGIGMKHVIITVLCISACHWFGNVIICVFKKEFQ